MRLLDCEVADNLCKSPAYSPQPSSLIPVSKRLDHDFFFFFILYSSLSLIYSVYLHTGRLLRSRRVIVMPSIGFFTAVLTLQHGVHHTYLHPTRTPSPQPCLSPSTPCVQAFMVLSAEHARRSKDCMSCKP